MSDEVLIKVEGVSKKFCRSLKKSLWYGMRDLGNELRGRRHGDDGGLRPDEFWAVKDVSFELKRGECLGLIGHNGAGKTTLLRMLNGLIKPDEGRIDIRGRVGALISLGAGFSPILTGRENIYVNAAVLGLTRQEIHHKIGDIIDFAGIREFIDAPVQSYSSGMQVRLGFSIASALNPDVLLLDEILAVGDTAFRSKCFQRIGKLLDRAAVIFVSHSEAQVSRICDSTMLLDSGMVRHLGNTAAGLRLYRESQRDQTLECHVVTHADVVSAAIARISAAVVWGGELAIDIVIELRDTVTLGQILVHLSLDNDYKANSEVHIDGACKPNLCAGRHIIRCSISPLHLAYGRYQVSVSIFDSSGKMTVVQLLDAARIEIIGPSSGGCAYLLPMSYEIVGATLIKDIDYNA